LDDPSGGFAVRAVTRKPDSDKAKALAKAGAEVVAADMDDVASLEKAFQGAYGAFCVTNFWEHLSPEKEMAQAANMAEAAKKTGLQHVIWSTLDDTREKVPLSDNRMPTLMEKYKVPHFDGKGEADRYFSDKGVPTTWLLTSFYWDNMIFFGMGPKKGPDGKLALTLPMGDKKLTGMAAEDIGKCAYSIFKRGKEFIGKKVGIAGEHLTGSEMAAEMTKALGKPVVYNAVSFEAYRGFGFPGAEDLGNMFQYYHDFNDEFCGSRDIAFSRNLNPSLQNFEAWLEKNKDRIPLE
ncbi:MAG TPA: NmrA/HSCARG family protein, partial [Nitrospiria bacterium]|nr:NmrA/HSCARG family protein [Nitrospiria bacterium]